MLQQAVPPTLVTHGRPFSLHNIDIRPSEVFEHLPTDCGVARQQPPKNFLVATEKTALHSHL
jgi:hypothetical protein